MHTQHDVIDKYKLHDSVPKIKFQVDICTTRMSAQHNLLRSVLRQWPAVKVFQEYNREMKGSGVRATPVEFPWKISDAEILVGTELEAVLNITSKLTGLAQSTKRFTGGY